MVPSNTLTAAGKSGQIRTKSSVLTRIAATEEACNCRVEKDSRVQILEKRKRQEED